ncbi:cyclic nucleotide-binding domain-containing protein [Jannaschia seohaensis]|uniref:CRP-like cAMP-binding protein n=1 Tax=Jannaschia seohaensis TaxID=475081 RepID=A0A2Y9ATE0_9RHOB|nr:cyclic nucleotide-binding domain-containing protein [Jannaschia seohaensis]PWJ18074.1 CRP-like cAMP-binding protein [Jannaschia seohaensis]SSA46598.1 cAMP-binding domain of CRP or a regulatory subunit of cAMP-dependent protein kinases [Jannaschia seohaensis]
MDAILTAAETLPPGLFNLAGMIGVGFYLGSYLLLQAAVIKGTGYLYPALNLTASALVLVSLVTNFNLYSAIVQISWIVISLGGMTRRYIAHRRIRFTDEEEALRQHMLGGLEPLVARRMFDRAEWVDVEPGRDFVTQGEPVDALWVLWDGAVDIIVEGTRITTMPAPTFVGELSVLNGEPSIGTARATDRTRVLRLPVKELQAVIAGNQATRLQLEGLLSRASRYKLGNANLRIARFLATGEGEAGPPRPGLDQPARGPQAAPAQPG